MLQGHRASLETLALLVPPDHKGRQVQQALRALQGLKAFKEM